MPLLLEIVSPERRLVSRPVEMAVIPAAEGEMGVMPGHSPMIVMLRGGVVALHEGGRVAERWFVDGGFAEITPERCTLLAGSAVAPDAIPATEAARGVAAAEQAYQAHDIADAPGTEALLDRLQVARARLEAAEG